MGSAAVFVVFILGRIELDMSRWEGEAASEFITVASKQSRVPSEAGSISRSYLGGEEGGGEEGGGEE